VRSFTRLRCGPIRGANISPVQGSQRNFSGAARLPVAQMLALLVPGYCHRLRETVPTLVAESVPERRRILHPDGSSGSDQSLAAPFHCSTHAEQSGIPALEGNRHARLPARLCSADRPAWLESQQRTSIET